MSWQSKVLEETTRQRITMIAVCLLMIISSAMASRSYPYDYPDVQSEDKLENDEISEANSTVRPEMECKGVAEVLVEMKSLFKLIALVIGVLILACIITCAIRKCTCCVSFTQPPPEADLRTLPKTNTLKKDSKRKQVEKSGEDKVKDTEVDKDTSTDATDGAESGLVVKEDAQEFRV